MNASRNRCVLCHAADQCLSPCEKERGPSFERLGSGLRVRSGYREEFEVPDLCDSVLGRQLKVCSVKGAGSQFVKIGNGGVSCYYGLCYAHNK